MKEGDIHGRTQINNRYNTKLEESQLSSENVQSIRKFVDKLKASGISKDRIRNYLWSFDYLDQHINFELENASEKQLVSLAGTINSELREELSEYSVAELKKTLSKYYGWHLDRKEDIKFLNTTVDSSRIEGLKPEEVLRPSEIRDIMRSCNNARDKALIMTLWSSGGRIEAVLNAAWNDVTLDGLNSKLRFRTNKTEPRRVPVPEAAPYLKSYAEKIDVEPSEYVFTMWEGNQKSKKDRGNDQLSYSASYKALKRAADSSDVPGERQTSAHGYRKSRATFLASTGMNAPQLMEFFGWSQMETAEKYVSLAQNQLESAFNEALGLEQKEDDGLDMDAESLKPQRCLTCGSIVSPAMKSCWNCSDNINPDNLLSALEPDGQKSQEDRDVERKLLKLADELDMDLEDV